MLTRRMPGQPQEADLRYPATDLETDQRQGCEHH
jgi:hypothetical protein